MLKVISNVRSKIAICLSGSLMPRNESAFTWQKNEVCVDYESLYENYLSRYDCDIFCFFWAPDPNYLESAGRFLAKLKPLRYTLHHQLQFPFSKTFGPNLRSNWFSIYQANLMRRQYEQEHRQTYRWVVRTRADVKYFDKADWSGEPGKLYIPSPNPGTLAQDWGGMNDQFAMSDSATMDRMTAIWEHIDGLDPLNLPWHRCENPEMMLQRYLIQNKFNVERFTMKYTLAGRSTW